MSIFWGLISIVIILAFIVSILCLVSDDDHTPPGW